MHYLLHGEHQADSRKYLTELVAKAKIVGSEIINLDGQSISINDLIQAVSNTTLFGSSVVVIENILSRKKSKESEELWQYLKNYQGECALILWEKKEIGKILQRNLPSKTTVSVFKTPALVFKLVEQIAPDNKLETLNLLETTLQSQAPEFIFAMLTRQIRMLLQVKLGKSITGAPWMLGKIKSQASKFNQDELESCYQKLYQIDKQIKTGATSMDLNWHLGYWLASL